MNYVADDDLCKVNTVYSTSIIFSKFGLHFILVILYKMMVKAINNTVISSQVLSHNGSLLHSKVQYTTLDYSSQLF
jgi:hypothetical protein